MSLSQSIIYGKNEDVEKILKTGPELNVIDEYGYTPLIQAAIVDSLPKAILLLDAGADVNFTDLTGRTALHWVADNGNFNFTRLLLERGADPNAYTRAGQPVLVMPLLKDLYNIKQLLYRYQANLSFAQDFINAKLLGHRFDLVGRVDVVDAKGVFNEVEFEGFYLEFTLALLASSLRDFKKNFAGKHLKAHFDKLQIVIESLERANELLKYQHYLIDKKKVEKRIDTLLQNVPLILPISYVGHAITFVKYGSWLIRCDRGEYGRDHGTIIIYRIGRRELFTNAFIKSLLYRRQFKEFIDDELAKYLELKKLSQLPISPQISGNCSWANVEAAIPATLFLLNLKERNSESFIDIQTIQKQACFFYEEWERWDKSRSCHFCLESFTSAPPARKASKAAILASILFQGLDFTDPTDIRMAERVLKILTSPDFVYILKAYIKVFSAHPQHERYPTVKSFMDQMGIDVENLS